jgi:ATP-dependent DNA helicase RecQ
LLSPTDILNKYWHYNQFRPQQEEIIMHVLSGKDTLAILPTGGGKSICYQLPALLFEGSCLVVSPLIALMKDQALGLEQRGIKSLAVHSGMHSDEVRMVYEKMSTGLYKFLFVSPERLKSILFLDYLSDWNIRLIAIDEAHCISQWGYDFRPSYLDIALIKKSLPQVPMIALTASATPLVQKDIIDKLEFKNHSTFFSTFARPNLSFSSFEVENKLAKTIDILQKIKGTCLVYCKNRKRTKHIADALNSAGLVADFYHAGLDQDLRSLKQENWIDNKTNIMVCTNAFGMGIDKADVRCVIHYDIPDTPESYYQEAGRAGRDGKKSYAVLLFQKHDLIDLHDGILLKYPAIETIKNIYESLAFYLDIGLNDGLESVSDFDVADFCKKFNFNILETLSAIKILEQQGYWTLSDSAYIASKISVVCTKEELASLEQFHPDLDEIMQHVLRLYVGIWHHYTTISELEIAQHARVGKDYVELKLRQLNSLGLIHYLESTTMPQLFYLHNRLPKKLLIIDIELIERLRKNHENRVAFMIDFAEQKITCRAIKLVGYFEEELHLPCGICDICLINKQNLRLKEDFESIKNNILAEIELYQTIDIDLFCAKHSSLKQELVMNIIRFLLDERYVELNGGGDLIKKK